jgi:hypothetical protein
MRLIDGIKEKGLPYNIPDCSRGEFPEFLKEMGYTTGAEIGVYKGEFTEKLCSAGLKMYGIDPWISFHGQGTNQKSQEVQNYNYEYAKRVLSPYKDCVLIRKTSMEALVDFQPGSLDFVYIDADHRFSYVADDIYEWYSKVKSGGIISGDDYNLTRPSSTHLICQVRPVVKAFVETFYIEDFYVFDGSWMFFRPEKL